MTPMQGKICLITGGTNGIGLATAQALAQMGATVVIVGRNPQKTAEVAADIRTTTGNPNVSLLVADLSSQAEIRRLADEFKSKYIHLHVLLNNAGAVFTERQVTVDGLEMTFALNHLGYFLLTELLIDTLKASGSASNPARIINVSSDAHANGKINFEDLQAEHGYSAFGAYGNSKLANILFTHELARRLAGSHVTANVLHPGVVSTGFLKNGTNRNWLFKLAGLIVPFFGRSPQKGAETSIYLASSPDVSNVTGKYFVDSKIAQSSPQANDPTVAAKLWDVSAKLVGLKETVGAGLA